MKYENVIKNAISFLISTQNEDGGISNECGGINKSGCLTTSETLEAFITTDFYPLNLYNILVIINMINYLLDNYIILSENMGYWRTGNQSSTMTTGHVIYSLNLVSNKFFSDKTIINIKTIKIDDQIININSLKNRINTCTENAFNWLLSIKNIDNGWGRTENQNSNATCCYYVLRAFLSKGLKANNNTTVNLACVFIENNLNKLILKKRKIGNEEFAEILYSYITLCDCEYILKYNAKVKNQILSIIYKRWKIIYQSFKFNLNKKNDEFINNLPWLALNVLMKTESYRYNRKIDNLIKYLLSNQETDGSWCIYKGQNKCNTWITAEILNDFDLIHKRYENYIKQILSKRKFKKLIISNTILLLVCIGFILTCLILYFFFDNINVLNSAWSFIIALIGLVSSFITIFDYFSN